MILIVLKQELGAKPFCVEYNHLYIIFLRRKVDLTPLKDPDLLEVKGQVEFLVNVNLQEQKC
jgi:hypothetical protein